MVVKKYWPAASKWEKYRALANDPFINQYLPETDLLSKESFHTFLSKYSVVFLKPVVGTGGYGVIKVERQGANKFMVQRDLQKKQFNNINKLFHSIYQVTRNKKYIIQRGIDLIGINNRPVDFRILLLRPQKQWQLMGIMGKWAAKNKIVTNHCQGGKAITLRNALKKSSVFQEDEYQQLEDELNVLGYQMAEILTNRFRYLRELGIDIAIDKEKKIWVLEANTKPMFNLFRHHENKSLFNKIYIYVKKIRKK